MRVKIDHGEETRGGMFSKKQYNTVTIKVDFTSEELTIIRDNDLEEVIVLKRPPPADIKNVQENILDVFYLRIRQLIKGADVYALESVGDARLYEKDLMEALPELKSYLEANAGIEEKSKTLEF